MPGLQRKSTSVLSRSGSVVKQASLAKSPSSASTASLKRGASQASTSGLLRKQSTVATSAVEVSTTLKQASIRKHASKSSQNGKELTTQGTKRDVGEETTKSKRAKVETDKDAGSFEDKKELLFRSGEYLALRDETDSFYLCQAVQHVYDHTDEFKIQWLEIADEGENIYEKSYICNQSADCIITHVKLRTAGKENGKQRYKLTDQQKAKVLKELIKAVRREKGEPSESEESEEEEEEKPKKTKARKKPAAKKKSGKETKVKPKSKPRLKKTESQKKKAKDLRAQKAKEKRDAKQKNKKEAWTPEQRKNPNLRLKTNDGIKVLNKDPLLESKENVPFVSPTAQSKLLHRAVLANDLKSLKQLIDDNKRVSKVNLVHSMGLYQDPLHFALEHENIKAIELLGKELFNRDPKKKPRVAGNQSLLAKATTGRYNVRSLGVPVIRALAVSRGSKEGNNAFTKDDEHLNNHPDIRKYAKFAMKRNADKKTLDHLLAAAKQGTNKQILYDLIWIAVRWGHRKLAGALMEEQTKAGGGGGFGFGGNNWNQVHKDVLLFENEDLKANIRAASVKKKPWDNCNVTPIHCAAINPNSKYLARLTNILPEYGLMDQKNRRPIHYAAACEGTGPMEFLMKRGQDPNEVDVSGMTCLHIACETGREVIVEFILKKAKQDAKEMEEARAKAGTSDEADEDEFDGAVLDNKYGVGGVNRPVLKPQNRYHYGYTPLHIATEEGFIDVAETLIKYDANVNAELGASKNKTTPLMKAAARGDLDMVKLLHKHDAQIEKKDKLKRTALTHAVMNGHGNVVSYLLHLGTNPNQADSSGNTCIHYAVGYGWYFCLKLLLEAGADPNIPNDWKMTPLGIGYLKGHMGLLEILLKQPGVDINFRDDKGMTLVAIACASPLEEGLYDQLDYLINKKNADCTIADVSGNTPLHHVARNNIKIGGSHWNPDVCPKAKALTVTIAELLVSKGCDPSTKNEEGDAPIMFAVEQGNNQLVEALVTHGAGVGEVRNKQGQNILHLIASQCMDGNTNPLLKTVQKSLDTNDMQKLISQVDHSGFTPLLSAVQTYADWNGSASGSGDADEEEDEEDEDEEEEPEDDEEEPMDDENGEKDEDEECVDDEPEDDDDEDEEEEEEEEAVNTPAPPAPADSDRPVTDDERKKVQQLQWGRDFMNILIDGFGATVQETVQKRHLTDDEQDKLSEKEQYGPKGKYNVVHFLLDVTHEQNIPRSADTHNAALIMMLARKPQVDLLDLEERSPLIRCIKSSWNEAAKLLLSNKASTTLASGNKDDLLSPPITLAARLNNLKLVEEFIAKKVDINSTDNVKRAPIHYAAIHSAPIKSASEMLKVVLKAGGKINAVDKDKRTPLHLAIDSNGGLADSGSELESYFIENGADVFAKDKRNRFPLHYAFVKIGRHTDASSRDPIELCNTMVSAMGQKLNTKDEFGQTPLHCAAVRGAGVCCMYLIQKGADHHLTDKDGNTALALAIKNGHESCTIMLMQKKADISVNINIPPPPTAEEKRKEAEAEKEQENEGADEDEERKKKRRKKPGWVIQALKKEDTREISVYPVYQGVIQKDWQGVLYLMLDMLDDFKLDYARIVEAALKTHKVNLARTLVRKVKNPKQLVSPNEDGQNLFHILGLSSSSGADKVMELLHDNGVSLTQKDKHSCTPLHYALLNNNYYLAQFIVEKAKSLDVDAKDSLGRSPMAALFWNVGRLGAHQCKLYFDRLLPKGAKVNFLCDFPVKTGLSIYGYSQKTSPYHKPGQNPKLSPLISAVTQGNFDVAKVLLNHGRADVNLADGSGMTALMHAVRLNNIHLVKLLFDFEYTQDGAKKRAAPRTGLKKKPSKRLFRLGLFGANDDGSDAGSDDGSDDGSDAEGDDDDEEEEPMEVEEDSGNYTSAQKKSRIDVNKTDSNGWTVLHHLVSPLPLGTYDNVAMLKVLLQANADPDIKNNDGKSAGEMARENAPKLLKELAKGQKFKPTVKKVSDNITWSGPTPNYKVDAEALIRKLEKEDDNDEKPVPKPDAKLELGENEGDVVHDEAQELYYDALLTKIDVQQGPYGLYNFYKLQLVHQKGKDLYVLLTRWGRIGDEGQFQRTPFPKKDECIKEFLKIFKAKTGNAWNNVKSFENKPKKYRLVDTDQRQISKKTKEVTWDLKSKLPSKLPQYVQDLMEDVTDTTALTATISRMGFDSELMPLGRIKKETLMEAKTLLDKIMKMVKKVEKRREKYPIENLEEYHKELEEVCRLSSEYYHMVPKSGYEYERLPPLDNKDACDKELCHIDRLLELAVASKMLAGAQHRIKEMNPLDYIYRSMGCQIALMDEGDAESQYLLKYVRNSSNSKVEAIFRVDRPGEDHRLADCRLENHRLLFHGSSTGNLISILSRGLLVAPPDAATTGYAFGKGVYTADMFSKSANYCYNWSTWFDTDKKPTFMLVAQVALGRMKEYRSPEYMEKAAKGCHSTRGRGKQDPNPALNITLPTGAMIPLGKAVDNPIPHGNSSWYYYSLAHNEYIVYDEKQVALKYVIQFKG